MLLRTAEVGIVLSISESEVLKLERAGDLHRIELPGLRAARFSTVEVRQLAQTWIDRCLARDLDSLKDERPEHGSDAAGRDVRDEGGREHHENIRSLG
jgi:hypothetical protein